MRTSDSWPPQIRELNAGFPASRAVTTAVFLLVVGVVPEPVQRLPYQCVRVEHEGGPFDRVAGSNPFRPDREFDCVLPA
jgi:hypothetical protein